MQLPVRGRSGHTFPLSAVQTAWLKGGVHLGAASLMGLISGNKHRGYKTRHERSGHPRLVQLHGSGLSPCSSGKGSIPGVSCMKAMPGACLRAPSLSIRKKERDRKEALKVASPSSASSLCSFPPSFTFNISCLRFLAHLELITSQVYSHPVLTDGFLLIPDRCFPFFNDLFFFFSSLVPRRCEVH